MPYGEVVSLKCGLSNFIGNYVNCFGGSAYSPVTAIRCPGNYDSDKL